MQKQIGKVLKLNNLLAVALMVCSSILNATGAFFLKKSNSSKYFYFFINKEIILGGLAFVASVFVSLPALKSGEVSKLYPIMALSYVWTYLFGVNILKENHNILKTLGIFIIILGVFLIIQ